MDNNTTVTREAMVRRIKATVQDPSQWLLVCRQIVETAGMDPAWCIPLGVALEFVCDAIVEEAKKRNRLDVLAIELAL